MNPLQQWTRRSLASLLLLSGLTVGTIASAEPVASVETADGTVFVTRAQGKRSILATGSSLDEGDSITTEKDSYASLRFIDGGEMAIRPLSSVLITRFQFKQNEPTKDGAVLRLLKGGLRTVTGLVGKRGNQDAYQLNGGTSTIGIRGTEFIARLCQNDCAALAPVDPKKKAFSSQSSHETPVVARVAEAHGATFVIPVAGSRRQVKQGDPLYAADALDVSPTGYAVLIFTDETRVVLNSGSQYVLTQVRYNPKQPERGMMGMELVKGGLRMVTGLLGKAHPEKVNVNTVVATIGIRGTNFDIICAQSGSDARGDDPLAGGAQSCDQALYAQTRDGSIELTSGNHKLRLGKGEVAYIDSPGALPNLLKEVPFFLKDNPAQKPEELTPDMAQLFGQNADQAELMGLYVEVKEGKVALSQSSGQSLLIQTGEIGFAGAQGQILHKLNGAPPFISTDAWMSSMRINPAACRAN